MTWRGAAQVMAGAPAGSPFSTPSPRGPDPVPAAAMGNREATRGPRGRRRKSCTPARSENQLPGTPEQIIQQPVEHDGQESADDPDPNQAMMDSAEVLLEQKHILFARRGSGREINGHLSHHPLQEVVE